MFLAHFCEILVFFSISELGQVNLSSDIPYSDETKRLIDIERNRVINQAIEIAENILTENKEQLENIVNFLVKKEIIHSAELREIIGKDKELDENEKLIENSNL